MAIMRSTESRRSVGTVASTWSTCVAGCGARRVYTIGACCRAALNCATPSCGTPTCVMNTNAAVAARRTKVARCARIPTRVMSITSRTAAPPLRSRRVVENRHVVARGAREHEEVPDKVRIAHTMREDVEGHARRIRHASRGKPEQPPSRHMQPERSCGNHDEPPHGEVERRAQLMVLDAAHRLEHHTEERERPDHREQRPSPLAMQRAERKWRVRACDEQVDGAVIHDPRYPLGTLTAECM